MLAAPCRRAAVPLLFVGAAAPSLTVNAACQWVEAQQHTYYTRVRVHTSIHCVCVCVGVICAPARLCIRATHAQHQRRMIHPGVSLEDTNATMKPVRGIPPPFMKPSKKPWKFDSCRLHSSGGMPLTGFMVALVSSKRHRVSHAPQMLCMCCANTHMRTYNHPYTLLHARARTHAQGCKHRCTGLELAVAEWGLPV